MCESDWRKTMNIDGITFDQKKRDDESNNEKLSYWKSVSSEELKNITIGQLVQIAADQYSHKTAICFFGGCKLTFTEVLDKVDTLAAGLENLGLHKGDHVALWGYNSVEWCISFLSICRAGFVAVNLNPLYEELEILSCLKMADVKALVMDEALGDRNFYDILKRVVPEMEKYDYNCHIVSDKLPLLRTVVVIGETSYRGAFKWSDLFDGVSEEQKNKIKGIQSSISPTDVCNIQFTSGTTSHPKGVLLTHLGMINTPRSFVKHIGSCMEHHRVCLQVPLFHVYGTVTGILGTFASGWTLVLTSAKFSPSKSINSIISEKCTIIHGTPTMYTDLLTISLERFVNEPDIFDKMSSIEVFVCGGALCLPETAKRLTKYFKNARFTSGYGLTETSATTTMSDLCGWNDVISPATHRVMEHIEVKVVDENDDIVPLGVPGELCVKGYLVMKEYYKKPEKTRAVLKNGWFHTGDKCVLLENGYVEIVGRIKDIIIRGGENIDPKDVEEVLIKHPEIIDVQVYGINDLRLGEIIAAAIIKTNQSNLTEDDVKKYCRNIMASYKIPQHVIFVSEFPRTASGKIQKYKLQEITVSLLKEKV